MGTAIDTEGASLEFFGQTQVIQGINIEYSTNIVAINNKNWSGHRLSSSRQSGLISSLGISLSKNNLNFDGNIYFQNFNLDKANIKEGYGIGISSSIVF